MEYKVIVSPLAINDIEKITDFYEAITIEIVIRFLEELEEAYKVLSINPHFQIKYKSYRSTRLKVFPYIVIFEIDQHKKEINILTCFQTARSTKKYPK